MNKSLLTYKNNLIIVLTIIIVAILLTIHYENIKKVDRYLNKISNKYKESYNIIQNNQKELSEIIFNSILENKVLQNTYREVNISSKSNKDRLRNNLNNEFKNKFKNLENKYLRQIHFHLANGESFLRMHKETLFGDDLNGIRESIKYVEKNKESISSFEVGKIFSSYRFVYPIVIDNKYRGSIEVSFSPFYTLSILAKQYKLQGLEFLIDKEISKRKLNNISKYHKDSFLNGYLYDIKIESKIDSLLKELSIRRYKIDDIEKIQKISQNDNIISIFTDEKIITVIPILNSISKNKNAILIIYTDNSEILSIINHNTLINFIILILIIILLIYLYKMNLEKKTLESSYNLLQIILNNTNGIKIIIDLKNILFCNDKFLDFFKVNSINEFDKEYNNFFEVIKNCKNCSFVKSKYCKGCLNSKSSKEKNIDTYDFIKNIQKSKQSDSFITITNKNGVSKIFSISIVDIKLQDSNKYLIELLDITDTILERRKIENRAFYDHLTGALNRYKFNKITDDIISSDRTKQLTFALIDIDFFKKINDNFGHQKGDEILIKFTKTIESTISSKQILARWGGEEFIILFINININIVYDICEKIRKEIMNIEDDKVTNLTTSIGLAQMSTKDSISETIDKADQALYSAKNSGRNRVIIFNEN